MAAIITNVTTDSTGDAVAFTAETTVFPEAVYKGATAILEARVPDEGWRIIHLFSDSANDPLNVNIAGAYELRARVVNAATGTDITINATE